MRIFLRISILFSMVSAFASLVLVCFMLKNNDGELFPPVKEVTIDNKAELNKQFIEAIHNQVRMNKPFLKAIQEDDYENARLYCDSIQYYYQQADSIYNLIHN